MTPAQGDWTSWVSTHHAVMSGTPVVDSGTPVVAGTRVPVALVLGSLAAVLTVDQVIEHYPRRHRLVSRSSAGM